MLGSGEEAGIHDRISPQPGTLYTRGLRAALLLRRVVDVCNRWGCGIVPISLGARRHHATHAWDRVTGWSISFHGRRGIQLRRVDVIRHTILFVGDHCRLLLLTRGRCRCWRLPWSRHRHDVRRLLNIEHGNHSRWSGILRLRTIRNRIIVILLHGETLGLKARLLEVRLKGRGVDRSLWNIREWSSGGSLARVGELTRMGIVCSLIGRCVPIDMSWHLLMEGLLFLLWWRMEVH